MKKILSLLLILFSISSCEYFTLMSQKEWKEKTGKEDDVIIYIGGAYLSGTDVIPCYWKIKNDKIERVDLEYISGTSDNNVHSIYVIDNDVYTCGFYENGNTQACYWINSKKYDLKVDDPLSFPSEASSIKVKSGVIFISGNADNYACFWVGEPKSALNKSGVNITAAQCIFIHQISSSIHEIYIGGIKDSHASNSKDNEIINLSDNGADSSGVNSIYVIGSIVFSAGSRSLLAVDYPCLWENNALTILPSSGGICGANSIFVSNEDIYIAGIDNNYPCYWKNKKLFSLPCSVLGISYSIYVYNDITYIAGRNNHGGADIRACIWKNNEITDLESVISTALCIFVVPDK